MKVRLVDYAANAGGGLRFAVEAARGMVSTAGVRLEVVSHGAALAAYRAALSGRVDAEFIEVPPANARAVRGRGLAAMPLVGSLARAIGAGLGFHFEVAGSVLVGSDVVWFPWLHSHRLPAGAGTNVVGSLHDLILLEFPEQFGRYLAASERETVAAWVASGARVVASSNATVATLRARLGVAPSRIDVVPLSGEHRAAVESAGSAPRWEFEQGEYILLPANIAPHKNHEVLLDALPRLSRRRPLVLTGPGTDLRSPFGRSGALRARARSNGLELGRDVVGLGYLGDADYYRLLSRAWCLAMPTLAEGGGSFPVWEALFEGVPVVCSDILVMREMVDRVRGDVTWFSPRDPQELAARLDRLSASYPAALARAQAQVGRLHGRSWDRVAEEYTALFAGVRAGG